VGVSSVTGDGMKEFFEAVEEAREEYNKDYLTELHRLQAERDSRIAGQKQESINRLMADMKVEEAERRAKGLPTERARFPDSDEEVEQDDDVEDSDHGDDSAPNDRSINMARARRVQDPAMEADGSKWPRPR